MFSKIFFTIILMSILNCSIFAQNFPQNISPDDDYKVFGRKETMTLGSTFSAVSNDNVIFNPANLAYVTDNRVTFGGLISNHGSGTWISFMAPNMSISSSNQKSNYYDKQRKSVIENFQKRSIEFAFGVSEKDIGMNFGQKSVAIGLAVKRRADELIKFGVKSGGGNAIAADLGAVVDFESFVTEFIITNINNPSIGKTKYKYNPNVIIGARFKLNFGLMLSVQGTSTAGYEGSDLGLHFGAQQYFMNGRLVSRVQLTPFYDKKLQAKMLNISANVGYKLNPDKIGIDLLQDMEFSYTLSFLTHPYLVATHMLVVSKYF